MSTIKTSKAQEDVESLKKDQALNEDIKSYFKERDITNRGNDGKIEDVRKMSQAEAETKQMLYDASVAELTLPEGFEPMFNSLILTARRNKIRTESGLMLTNSMLGDSETDYMQVQEVLAVGPNVQQVTVGSLVCINFEHFRAQPSRLAQEVSEEKSKIKVPIETIDDQDFIAITERDLKYILKKK